ncbi:MAG: agmatinase [Candidatus Micrarchaeota archaeon]
MGPVPVRTLPPYNFPGVDPVSFEKAKAIVIPVPYDSTTSWHAGARHGPSAIIAASRWLETYDEELKYEAVGVGFHTLDELEPDYSSPEKMASVVASVVGSVLDAKKFPLMLGGEHSISAGAFSALKKCRPKASVLYFDAHPDLREEFEGTRFGHACAARRGLGLGLKIAQVGIRSVSEEDAGVYKKNPQSVRPFYAFEKDGWDIAKITDFLSGEVYVSFDVDAFDSSLMPATGTPEPGGLSWHDAMRVLAAVSGVKKIIGADVVELSPRPGLHACDFLCAKLAYKIASYAFAPKSGRLRE